MKKKVVFLTGTRAEFGKLKALINILEKSDFFETHIFVTGMHMLKKYGSTINEIKKEGYSNIYSFINQSSNTDMDSILSNTIMGFSHFIKEIKPDLIVVHGDRIETLACSIVGAINNVLVAHIEGGEVSGTIDELMRHAITKMSHIHFIANEEAKKRLIQLGEKEDSIFIIGSPDIDIMKSSELPPINFVKNYYEIPFDNYAVFIYHPITTEIQNIKKDIQIIVSSLIKSNRKYVIIHPNNDPGSEIILEEINKLKENKNFKIFPSIRFERFLVLLKNANFVIGNSSSAIKEATFYGVPVINLGTRQKNRSKNKDIMHMEANEPQIISIINKLEGKRFSPSEEFGDGQSARKFFNVLNNEEIWKISCQKQFVDRFD